MTPKLINEGFARRYDDLARIDVASEGGDFNISLFIGATRPTPIVIRLMERHPRGMELARWADCRVMAQGAYMGTFNRRWGIALTDGATVRLPRLVGQGRALELIMTARKVDAEECYRIGLCELIVPKGQARKAAEEMAHRISKFPQVSLRADRRSVYLQEGLPILAALEREWDNSAGTFKAEGAAGAARFAKGAGRHGEFVSTSCACFK